MPWQSLIQIPSFFAPPAAAPQQDDAAEFHAAQQFGNVVAWSLAAVMALSFLVDPPLVEAETPPVEPEVIGSGHLVQVGKFESVLVIPSHGFDPPWPPTPDVVVEPPLSGANQVVLADPFYQTVLVPGSSFDPPWPPPAEVVDESPFIEVSRQLVGLMPTLRREGQDLSFTSEPPFDGTAEYVGADQVGNDPLVLPLPGRGTLAEAPIEPNLPVVPVDDPTLALLPLLGTPLLPPFFFGGFVVEPPVEPTLPVAPVDDPTLPVSTQLIGLTPLPPVGFSALGFVVEPPLDGTAEAVGANQVGNHPLVLPPPGRGTLAEPPAEPTLPVVEPPTDPPIGSPQLVQVGKFYSVIAAPSHSFDPPWDTSAGVAPFDPTLLPPVALALPFPPQAVRAGWIAEPPWDTSAGVLPFDPALLVSPMVGGLPAGLAVNRSFLLEAPIYPSLPVVPVVPPGGIPSLGMQEVGGAQLHIDEVRAQVAIEERNVIHLEIIRWEE